MVAGAHWASGLAVLAWFLGGCTCLAGSATTATTKTARDYGRHDYYAIHLSPGVDPRHVADHLGLHYDGPLGQLEDHYVLRAETRQHGYDHIGTLQEELRRRRRRKRDTGATAGVDAGVEVDVEGAVAEAEVPHVLDSVLLAQKQELHKRFPLVKRSAVPPPPPWLAARQGAASDPVVEKGTDIVERLGIADPIFPEQWHLLNRLDAGHDINVTGVWAQGITGKNSTVCIVDDGLDMDSDDLRANYFATGSFDFNDQVPDPKPRLSDDRHGTRCAGEVAAVRNDVCGVGIAYDGLVSGVRILSQVISDVDEAAAMNYAYQDNQIYSCSWGPPDDGRSMEEPGILIRRAMVTGVQQGRGGRGSIYVFAIGNGAAHDDNCNFDGYTNSIYSVSVGAIDRKGHHPYYSEQCSAQLVVTYSSGSSDAIHTTDVGQNQCYTKHGGTSAAGPLVAGMYALVLEANPSLSWRDIQWITVLTAVKVDEPSDWALNLAVGKEFSHQFGYGKADAFALVEAAKNWTNVKPQAWYISPWMHVKHPIPQGDQGLASNFNVTKEMMHEANLERLEHVTVTMNVDHTRRGDLSVELRSPSGMVSHIATARRNDDAPLGYVDWTFMTVAHWGDAGVGTWTVIVKDTNINEHTGNFTDWRLKLWGESRDPSIQDTLPLPSEDDDDDHDVYHEPGVHTTSVAVPTETGVPAGNPSDHPHRPINSKTEAAGPPDATLPASPSATATEGTDAVKPPPPVPTDEVEGDDKAEDETPDAASPTSTAKPDEHLLPQIFPTFGVTKKTQVWIYGSAVLILVFLAGLGIWYYRVRRRRRWMSDRDGYEFEMVGGHDDDDDDDDNGPDGRDHGYANGHANGAAKSGTTGKAGRLYDAFAPGSDDESLLDEAEAFNLGDDSDESDEDGNDEDGRDSGDRRTRYRDDEPLTEGADVR